MAFFCWYGSYYAVAGNAVGNLLFCTTSGRRIVPVVVSPVVTITISVGVYVRSPVVIVSNLIQTE